MTEDSRVHIVKRKKCKCVLLRVPRKCTLFLVFFCDGIKKISADAALFSVPSTLSVVTGIAVSSCPAVKHYHLGSVSSGLPSSPLLLAS